MTSTPTDEAKPTTGFFKAKWGGSESLSGKGSSLAYTENLRSELPSLIQRHKVNVLLDAPCGDFHWMRMVELPNTRYIGMELVPELVADNQARYASPSRQFLQGDITLTPLPAADLMMCRDCLFHLPYDFIYRFFQNFLRAEIPLLLLTSNLIANNKDIPLPGGWRQLNMTRRPFLMPPAMESIEDWIEGHPRRYMGLWSRMQVAAFFAKAPLNFSLPASRDPGR